MELIIAIFTGIFAGIIWELRCPFKIPVLKIKNLPHRNWTTYLLIEAVLLYWVINFTNIQNFFVLFTLLFFVGAILVSIRKA